MYTHCLYILSPISTHPFSSQDTSAITTKKGNTSFTARIQPAEGSGQLILQNYAFQHMIWGQSPLVEQVLAPNASFFAKRIYVGWQAAYSCGAAGPCLTIPNKNHTRKEIAFYPNVVLVQTD